MPRGIPIPIDELTSMMELFADCRKRGMSLMDSYERIGQLLGRDTKVIASAVVRLKPTTDLGRMYLKAKAYKLVKRLVKKASPPEIIDILSRPNIGILESNKRVEGNSAGNFFISVNAESCGAVKVGVAQVALPPAEDEETFDPFRVREGDVIEGTVLHGENGTTKPAVGDAEDQPQTLPRRRAEGEDALSRAKRRIAEAVAEGGGWGE